MGRCMLQDFKGAAALSAEAKALAAQADISTAKAKKLRQQVGALPQGGQGFTPLRMKGVQSVFQGRREDLLSNQQCTKHSSCLTG